MIVFVKRNIPALKYIIYIYYIILKNATKSEAAPRNMRLWSLVHIFAEFMYVATSIWDKWLSPCLTVRIYCIYQEFVEDFAATFSQRKFVSSGLPATYEYVLIMPCIWIGTKNVHLYTNSCVWAFCHLRHRCGINLFQRSFAASTVGPGNILKALRALLHWRVAYMVIIPDIWAIDMLNCEPLRAMMMGHASEKLHRIIVLPSGNVQIGLLDGI